jgi:hypothetical protein
MPPQNAAATDTSDLPQLDMSKSIPVSQAGTVPVPAGATFSPVNSESAESLPALDMSKSVPVPAGATFTPVDQQHSTGSVTGDIALGALKGSVQKPGERGVLENLAGGFEKGAAETVTGAANLVARGVEMATGKPKGSLSGTMRDDREQPSAARDVGEGAENIAEFATGDEALQGLSKATKIVQMAEKYPLVARTLEMAKSNPTLRRILTSAVEGGTVGGAQGAVHGAAEGKTAQGAEGGAIGGALGGATAESATAIAKGLGKAVGIGTTAVEDATRGAKPGKRNTRFADDFQKAAPLMDAEAKTANPKSIEEWADVTDDARRNLWEKQVKPLVARHETVPLGGINIRNAMETQIPAAMKRFSPEEAAKVTRLANEFMPGQVFALQVGDAEEALEHFNAKLSETGYWSKMPSERAALLRTNGDVLGYKTAADAIRDELYGKLQTLEPESNMRDLKAQYGALRNVGSEIRGQVNVVGRQVPISLKQTIGLAAGLAHGGPAGAAIAGLPVVDKIANSPERLIARGVQKAARPGEEGTITKVAKKIGSVAVDATPAVAAVTGEKVGESMPSGQHALFRASDNSFHTVPLEQLDVARQRDPGLTVLSEK